MQQMRSSPTDGRVFGNRFKARVTQSGYLEIVFEFGPIAKGIIDAREIEALPADVKDAKGVLCGRRLNRYRGSSDIRSRSKEEEK